MDGGKRPDRGDRGDDDKGKRKATRRDGAPPRRLNLESDDEEETGPSMILGRGRGRGRGRGSTSSDAGPSEFNPQNNGAGHIVNPSNVGMIIPENLDMEDQGYLELGIDIANLLFPPAGGVLPPPAAPPVAPPAAPPAAPPPAEQEEEPEE